jgi:hypothetical protein
MSRILTVAAMAVAAMVVGSGAAHAQDYDASFFAKLQPGTAVEGRSGCTWEWSQSSNAAPGWGGWYQQCSTPSQQAAPTTPLTPTVTEADCVGYIDAYTQGEKALACALLQISKQTPVSRPTFQVGQRYVAGYDSYQIVVIGLTRDVVNNEVVVYQWVLDNTSAKAGDVGAFVNGSPSSFTWRKVQ